MKVEHRYHVTSVVDENGKVDGRNWDLSALCRSLKFVGKNENFSMYSVFEEEFNVGEDKLRLISCPMFVHDYSNHGIEHYADSAEEYSEFVNNNDLELASALNEMSSYAIAGKLVGPDYAHLESERQKVLNDKDSKFPTSEELKVSYSLIRLESTPNRPHTQTVRLLEDGLRKDELEWFMLVLDTALEEGKKNGVEQSLDQIVEETIKVYAVGEEKGKSYREFLKLLKNTAKYQQSEPGSGSEKQQ